jgi:uncharacterized protein (TIGR03086 family)
VAALTGWREQLDSAVSYMLAGAAMTTPDLLSRPTPCSGWDLETLLDHLSDSIEALGQAIAAGCVTARAAPPCPGPRDDPVTCLRGQAARLLAACSSPSGQPVAVGDRELTAEMVAVTAAIEITVHGWDISAACGTREPIPARLAIALLPAAALLITPRTRPGLFADPVRLPGSASPGDQLVAFLGRQPQHP